MGMSNGNQSATIHEDLRRFLLDGAPLSMDIFREASIDVHFLEKRVALLRPQLSSLADLFQPLELACKYHEWARFIMDQGLAGKQCLRFTKPRFPDSGLVSLGPEKGTPDRPVEVFLTLDCDWVVYHGALLGREGMNVTQLIEPEAVVCRSVIHACRELERIIAGRHIYNLGGEWTLPIALGIRLEKFLEDSIAANKKRLQDQERARDRMIEQNKRLWRSE